MVYISKLMMIDLQIVKRATCAKNKKQCIRLVSVRLYHLSIFLRANTFQGKVCIFFFFTLYWPLSQTKRLSSAGSAAECDAVKAALIRCHVGSGVSQFRCFLFDGGGVSTQVSTQLAHNDIHNPCCYRTQIQLGQLSLYFCFILFTGYNVNLRYVCLFIKKKSIPLAEASPSAFTSVIWSCCVPSSSITATEKPTDGHNQTKGEIQSLILFVLFEISQFESVRCCSVTTERLSLLKAKFADIKASHLPLIINKIITQ